MVFLSSHSHRTVDFSIQKTWLHVSWNKHHSFSVCFSLSTAPLDKTHLAVCVGFAGSVAGPWSTGWAGPGLCFQPQIPLHLQSPVMVWCAFPPDLFLHLSLKLATQPRSSDKVSRASTAPFRGTTGLQHPAQKCLAFPGKECLRDVLTPSEGDCAGTAQPSAARRSLLSNFNLCRR